MAEHIHASKQQALAAYDQARIDHDARSIPLAMPQQLVAEIDRIQSQRSKATRSKSRTSNQKS
jgi:hypothetical protein